MWGYVIRCWRGVIPLSTVAIRIIKIPFVAPHCAPQSTLSMSMRVPAAVSGDSNRATSLMLGGAALVIERLRPLFITLAPAAECRRCPYLATSADGGAARSID